MAEERKSWSAWFQRRIDQRDENDAPVGFCWLDDPEPEDDYPEDRSRKPKNSVNIETWSTGAAIGVSRPDGPPTPTTES